MQARGPLMIEHRLIERMLAVVRRVLAEIDAAHRVDPHFVDTAVDFIRVYADRTHHGKEEDILFRKLAAKPLSAEDRRVMEELIEEHRFARRITKELVAANNDYRHDKMEALADIAAALRTLTEFYPRHIEKEDRIFFPAARGYCTEAEDQALLAEFWEFDRKMIHEKYAVLVTELEK